MDEEAAAILGQVRYSVVSAEECGLFVCYPTVDKRWNKPVHCHY